MRVFSKPEVFASVGLLVFYNNWLLSYFLNPRMSYWQSYVSELDANGQPHVWFFRIGNLLGASLLLTGFLLIKYRQQFLEVSRHNLMLTKFFLIISSTAILNAFFPMDCSASQSLACFQKQQRYSFSFGQWIHLLTALIMFGGLILANFYVVYTMKHELGTKAYWLNLTFLILQMALNTFIAVISITGYGPIGLLQRLSLILFEAWVIIILFSKKPRYFLPTD